MADYDPEERVLSSSSEEGRPESGAMHVTHGGPLPRRPPKSAVKEDPHSASELGAALLHPFSAMELVLADQARVARDILEGKHLLRLIAVFLGVSVVFTVPYGFVLGIEQGWRVSALFLGSVAVCLPSLQVFSNFIGIRTNVQCNMALTLLLTAVAAAFSFGFFPILWFLRATMADGASVDLAGISVFFLAIALAAGVAQLLRCMAVVTRINGQRDSLVLIAFWMLLLLFVSVRMARALGLLA